MKKIIIISVIITLIITMGFLFGKAKTENNLLSAADWEKLRLENLDNPNYVVIDVRTPEEYNDDHIDGAINIDFYNPSFRQNIDSLDQSKNYLIYCRSGSRSGNAAELFLALGFPNVYDLDYGMIGYSDLQ